MVRADLWPSCLEFLPQWLLELRRPPVRGKVGRRAYPEVPLKAAGPPGKAWARRGEVGSPAVFSSCCFLLSPPPPVCPPPTWVLPTKADTDLRAWDISLPCPTPPSNSQQANRSCWLLGLGVSGTTQRPAPPQGWGRGGTPPPASHPSLCLVDFTVCKLSSAECTPSLLRLPGVGGGGESGWALGQCPAMSSPRCLL